MTVPWRRLRDSTTNNATTMSELFELSTSVSNPQMDIPEFLGDKIGKPFLAIGSLPEPVKEMDIPEFLGDEIGKPFLAIGSLPEPVKEMDIPEPVKEMDIPEFLGDEIADRLSVDQYKCKPFLAIGSLPEPVKDWIIAHFPGTSHVRFGWIFAHFPESSPVRFGEIDGKLEWWIYGYPAAIVSEIYRPAWKHILLTRRRI